ncbi:MAG: CDP-diacylglycerol--serine O-phosphatidyltransferase [Acidobacteria bacterium]|nr:CDP-diacylglycerol--serine O-phosphatidyltransferase [Acidobacteriota bacterium]MCU0253526.1 CDP-diacylglycerol--serine O-phosphatidyltransferase [Acidobacteriota bacterium]
MNVSHGRPHHAPHPLGVRLRGAAGWLPGALTLGNVLAGFSSIIMASQGRLAIAAVLVLGAFFLDGLDGRLARMTGTTSEFGEQLDSIADGISFAVAPSLFAFFAGLDGMHRMGWAVAFLFTACGVIRLARFSAGMQDPRFFIGLPSPTAAAIAVCPALITGGERVPHGLVPVYAAVVAAAGLLMVSKVRFRSFKDLRFGRRPYRVLALWALVIAGFVALGEWMVPAMIVAYLLSPLLDALLRSRAGLPHAPARDYDRLGSVPAGGSHDERA